jgi:cytochrome c553
VFVTGSAKASEDSAISVPPGLARLAVVTTPDQPAYLRIDQLELTQTFQNPGSPVISSDGGKNAIVWVLDSNAPRTAPLQGPGAPQPILYAFDALSLQLLWRSTPGSLAPSGKYNEPTVVGGMVFVGTDRIEAFGVGRKIAERLVSHVGAERNERHSAGAAEESKAEGAHLFASRCASCHESGQPGIPPPARLATLGVERIVSALAEGLMRDMAAGLSAAQMDAIAAYLAHAQDGSER